jgi:hypothetical protein
MHRLLIISVLLFLPFIYCSGQKALLLERNGTYKTRKFFTGETLIYKLKSDRRHWLEEVIVDLDLASGYILFENRTVPVEEIYAIQIRDGGGLARKVSAILTTFSYSWGFWTLVSLGFGEKLTAGTIGIGVGSFLAGKLLKLAFFKTYVFNKRKRLRLIDLTFYELRPGRT